MTQEEDGCVSDLSKRTEVAETATDLNAAPPSSGGMLRFATAFDKRLMVLGSLCAVIHGSGMPILSIVFGKMTTTFLQVQSSFSNVTTVNESDETQFSDTFNSHVSTLCLYYVYLGIIMLITSYGQIVCWEVSCERQMLRMRERYLSALLRQDTSWWEQRQGAVSLSDVERVREGMGDKCSLLIQYLAAFITAFVVGFAFSWKLTLVMTSLTPLLAATAAWMAKMMSSRTRLEQKTYGVAGAIVYETLSSIRTIFALNAQKRQIENYETALKESKKCGLWKHFWMSVGIFFSFLIMFSAYAIAFWYGSVLILSDENFSKGTVFTVFTRLPVVLSSSVTVLAGIIIAFVFGWKMSLVLLVMIPLVMGSGYFEFSQRFGKQKRDAQQMEEAGKTAMEAINNIDTVQALNRQELFLEKYAERLHKPHRHNLRLTHFYGGTFGFSQSVIFFLYAAAFRYGVHLVSVGEMVPIDVYRVFFAISFCAVSFGQLSSFIPDVVKAQLSATLFFNMIEQEPSIDQNSEAGLKPKLTGAIKLKKVYFTYPNRPVPVIQGVSLSIKPGQTVAFVGASGCGKSTLIALLQRFYDINQGQIIFDDYALKTLNLNNLRRQIGFVSQEPTLFGCTIRENILYGLDEEVTQEQIESAAKLANAHDFITNLPSGYDTNVGEKGSQLSGGQQQRIAIARALVRDSRILILDEPTSALDSQSEQLVQEALERAKQGRTCLIIAHRLATIQNADMIFVLRNGTVAEKGTHSQLLSQRGLYHALYETQQLN